MVSTIFLEEKIAQNLATCNKVCHLSCGLLIVKDWREPKFSNQPKEKLQKTRKN